MKCKNDKQAFLGKRHTNVFLDDHISLNADEQFSISRILHALKSQIKILFTDANSISVNVSESILQYYHLLMFLNEPWVGTVELFMQHLH